MSSWIDYVLISESSDITYSGMTQDLERRLAEHNSGKSKFTSAYTPWRVIHSESARDCLEARKREKYFKSAAGRRFIKKIIKGNAGSLPD